MIVISSLMQMKQLSFNLYSFFEKNIIRCGLFSSFHYINCLLNTKLDVFISILKGLFKSIIINISLLIILYLIWLKTSYCFCIYLKALSLFINFIKDIVNCLNLLMKRRQKLMNLRNPRIFLIFVGCGQCFIILIFLSFISIVSSLILNPRQSIFWLQKVPLYMLTYKLVCSNIIKMKYIYSLYFYKILLKIRMSFR